MIICHCRVVSDHEIRDAISSGATAPQAIAAACRAGTECGGCLPEVRRILDEQRSRVSAGVTARDVRRRLAGLFEPSERTAV